MADHSPTHSFSSLHHRHHHRQPFPLTLPSFQSSEDGYASSRLAEDSLPQYGSRGEESCTSFMASNTSSGVRKGSSGGDRIFFNTSASSLDPSFEGGDSGLGHHFDDSWYGSCKKEVWDPKESCESSSGNFNSKDDYTNNVFYTMNCAGEEGVRRRVKSNYNNYAHESCDIKSEQVYSSQANASFFTKQSASCNRAVAGSCDDSSGDYNGTATRGTSNCLGREDNYGSSCGSGEDQIQPVEVRAPWLSVSQSNQDEGRWRGATVDHAVASGCLSQRSHIGINSKTYPQKLDSFSDAFLSQRKRRFPGILSGDSLGQIWELGPLTGETGVAKSRQSCVFDSDSYVPPSSSASSSPAHPSLPSYPSPPTSSQVLMPSVLSPPPTPLPPPSLSPSKMDSPSAHGGTANSASQGGESFGMVQLFSSRLQPSVHSSGIIWKFPLLPHCFPQSAAGNTEDSHRSSHGNDCGNVTGTHEVLQSHEPALFPSSSEHPSIHQSRALGPSNSPSLHASSPLLSHLSDQHQDAAEKNSHLVGQRVTNGAVSLFQSQPQQQATSNYTGTPFTSILQSSRGQKKGHYTPQPLLNPLRRGTGLYSSISSLHHREGAPAYGGQEELQFAVNAHVSRSVNSELIKQSHNRSSGTRNSECVNVGPDFQADLPLCFADHEWSDLWPQEVETQREQLLWKPSDILEESANLQDQVVKLVSMCSSSCLPGGGSNTELALHCLHYCQGNTMATLEMLLFSEPSPAGDYHYSGCDFWSDAEKSLFSAALGLYGKDFSLIQKMVRTKTVRQCVEFYYLGKKLLDKQKKQKEEEEEEIRNRDLEQQKNVPPICQPAGRPYALEEVVPVPSLASYFPCKLCGKMFYKIKSRNAHMKIHRQPQEDWADRRLQHQLLSQNLALNRLTNLMPAPARNRLPVQVPAAFSSDFTATSSSSSSGDNVHHLAASSNVSVPDPSTPVSYGSVTLPNSHDCSDSNQREPSTVLPFHQSWGSFGHSPDPSTFYCSPERKEDVGGGTVGEKQTIKWQ
ncbi:uncharacterized protein KZ484_008812 isoform 2-T2 [Pholidichthys leucotaenia]